MIEYLRFNIAVIKFNTFERGSYAFFEYFYTDFTGGPFRG
jgi:hypothetical protein